MRTRGGGGRTGLAVSHTKLKQEVWSCVTCLKESTHSVDNLYKYLKIKKNFKTEKDLERFEAELKDIVLNNIKEKIDELLVSDKTFSKYLKKLQSKDIDPFLAGDKITKSLVK